MNEQHRLWSIFFSNKYTVGHFFLSISKKWVCWWRIRFFYGCKPLPVFPSPKNVAYNDHWYLESIYGFSEKKILVSPLHKPHTKLIKSPEKKTKTFFKCIDLYCNSLFSMFRKIIWKILSINSVEQNWTKLFSSPLDVELGIILRNQTLQKHIHWQRLLSAVVKICCSITKMSCEWICIKWSFQRSVKECKNISATDISSDDSRTILVLLISSSSDRKDELISTFFRLHPVVLCSARAFEPDRLLKTQTLKTSPLAKSLLTIYTSALSSVNKKTQKK